MQVLSLKTNHNNKLNCVFFTAILAVKKYTVKENIIVEHNNNFRFATVLERKEIYVNQLSDWHTYIDKGIEKKQYLKNLKTWYPHVIDLNKTPLYYYLIKNTSTWRSMEAKNNPLKP